MKRDRGLELGEWSAGRYEPAVEVLNRLLPDQKIELKPLLDGLPTNLVGARAGHRLRLGSFD
jgi:hypothetical protein